MVSHNPTNNAAYFFSTCNVTVRRTIQALNNQFVATNDINFSSHEFLNGLDRDFLYDGVCFRCKEDTTIFILSVFTDSRDVVAWRKDFGAKSV